MGQFIEVAFNDVRLAFGSSEILKPVDHLW
jgi:hypothetical protein